MEKYLTKDRNIILIIDDSKLTRLVLKNIFKASYRIEEAKNGIQGLEKLRDNCDSVCAVLLDVVMPEMDGMEMLHALMELDVIGKIPFFLITADDRNEITEDAYHMGVMDVIHKPIVPYMVRRRVDSIVELFESRRRLSDIVEIQREELLQKTQNLYKMSIGMLEALSTAIEFRSDETGSHIQRIRSITLYLLQHTDLGKGLTNEEIELIGIASICHDVGKISIPDSILNKPGKLTDEEYKIMKTHTTRGAQLLSQIPQMQQHKAYRYAYDIALHHHERWDGKGYPEGLKGNQLSLWAQIVSIADVYDALVSKRCYKEGYSFDKALEMIINGECGVFNPALLDAFIQVEKKIRVLYDVVF